MLSSSEAGASLNYGLTTGITIDFDVATETVALMRFDLSSIPTSCKILNATLKVWTVDSERCGVDVSDTTVNVYRLLEAWDPGDKDSTPGFAIYLERRPGVRWTSPGAGVGSRSETPEVSFVPTAIGQEWPVDITGVVRAWVELPQTNHGFVLKNSLPNGDGICFLTSDYTDKPERRPLLTVTFDNRAL